MGELCGEEGCERKARWTTGNKYFPMYFCHKHKTSCESYGVKVVELMRIWY